MFMTILKKQQTSLRWLDWSSSGSGLSASGLDLPYSLPQLCCIIICCCVQGVCGLEGETDRHSCSVSVAAAVVLVHRYSN